MTRFVFPARWRVFVSLCLLQWVASFSHEFTHHLTAALVCGDVGRMSLNRFVVGGDCAVWPIATIAGPALSYLMMWLGAALILQGRRPLLGLALVVAYIPFLRLLTAAMGGGDEGVLMKLLMPAPAARFAALALVVALVLPPLVVCWRALANRRRAGTFFAAFLIPLLPILALPSRDAVWYGEWLAWREWLPNFFGVPWSVWGVHAAMVLLCALALWRWRRPGLLDVAEPVDPAR